MNKIAFTALAGLATLCAGAAHAENIQLSNAIQSSYCLQDDTALNFNHDGNASAAVLGHDEVSGSQRVFELSVSGPWTSATMRLLGEALIQLAAAQQAHPLTDDC